MPLPSTDITFLSRVEAGGTRSLPPDALRAVELARAWDGIRLVRMMTAPKDVPEGHFVNHLVTMNLGAEMGCDANFGGRGWHCARVPHHGLGVYPALVRHAARCHDARDVLLVELAPDFVSEVLESGSTRELQPTVGARDPFAEHVLLALAEVARVGGPSDGVRAEALGTALVAHLAAQPPAAAPGLTMALASPSLRRVLDYVGAHLDQPLTLRTLAGLAGMDLYRFVRAFKQSTGLSPHQYLLQARINRAKQLLAGRSLSITEIALQTGFATPSHFSVTFRRIAGMTPRAYRDGAR